MRTGTSILAVPMKHFARGALQRRAPRPIESFLQTRTTGAIADQCEVSQLGLTLMEIRANNEAIVTAEAILMQKAQFLRV